MAGDRIGVGYDALPPAARDVHDRLAPLGLKPQQRGERRALQDIASRPEPEKCSDVLWMLRLPGFLRALVPVPALAEFVVEAVSNACARLPDPVLPPWPPTLIGTLRSGGAEQAPLLIREAGRLLPGRLGDLDPWVPPWRVEPDPRTARPQGAGRGAPLLAAHPATCGAVAELLGCDVVWETTDPGPRGAVPVRAHPAAAMALHALPAP